MSGPVSAPALHTLSASVVDGHGLASCSCHRWSWVCLEAVGEWPEDHVMWSFLAHVDRQADFDAIADALDHPGHYAETHRAFAALDRLRGAGGGT